MPTARPTGADAGASLAGLTVLVPDGRRVDSRSAVAYYVIRDLIVTLELPPGQAVVERELMDRLSLGRTPVREALRRLADEGLVSIYARRGMVVAPVHVGDLAEISEVRLELEGLAARQAARRADARDRQAAEDLVAQVARRSPGQGKQALIRVDQRVHHCVHRASHNDYLQATLEKYLTLSLRLWCVGLDRVDGLDAAVAEHTELLRAVIDGDATAAEAAARSHVAAFWDAIRAVLVRPPAPGRRR